MPSSSRSKSHKEIKHSSREYDDFDIRVSKDSLFSGEQRKLFENGNANGNANWNGNDEFSKTTKCRKDKIGGDDGEVVNIDVKKLNSKDLLKDVDESKKGEKKYDKECGREEGTQVKENKFEKEKKIENQAKKRGREDDQWPIEEELRNIELEKELKTRMKRREGYSDKDIRHKDEVYKHRESSSKSRDVKHRREIEKNREDGERDRKREDRNYRQKEERYWEDFELDYRHKTGQSRDDTDRRKRSRDQPSELETKHSKDDSHRQDNSHGGSPIYDDRIGRHKDSRDRRRDSNKDETKDNRSRESERGRAGGHDDMDTTANHSRRRSSPGGKSYSSRDHHRISNQEERACHNGNSNRDDKISSQSLEKITQKDDNRIDDLSVQKGPRSDLRSSTISPSSRSNERRDLNGQDVRRNPAVEEFNNRHQRSGDLSRGILSNGQTNWNNFPNWSSPIVNGGYLPFHQVPPPIFNPVMPQFLPPIFGRPPMNMNHAGMPFYGHENPIAWRFQVAESIPSPFHGYGNWDHGTTQLNNQILEASTDMESAVQKIDHLIHGPTGEIWSGHTGQPDMQAETMNNAPEIVKVTKEDDSFIARAYLSKIDISKDLTRPDLYDQCRSILDLNQASDSDELDCKILFLEPQGVEDGITKGASLFPAIDDAVFKKAMSLYTKHKVPFISAPDQEKSCSVDDSKLVEALEGAEVDEPHRLDLDPIFDDMTNNNIDKSDEKLSTSNAMDMELDHPVENQDEESCAPSADGYDVKVEDSCNYDVNKEIDIPSGDGSLLILTNVSNTELTELWSVNLSRIHHSPESTH